MGKVVVNLSAVSTDREVVPAGVYEAQLGEVKPGTSKAGNQYLNWIFTITGGDFAGAKLYHNTTLTEKSLWNLKRTVEALGVTAEELSDPNFELETDEFIGAEVVLVITQEMYQGRPVARVNNVLPPGSMPAADEESAGATSGDWSFGV